MATASKSKTIRNLMWVPQNLRFMLSKKDKYEIELKRRGEEGDVAEVPVEYFSTTAYKQGIDRFFEEITRAEAEKIVYYEQQNEHGYELPVSRESANENVINTEGVYTDPRTGRQYRRVGPVGPRVARVPGGDLWQGQQIANNAAQAPVGQEVEMPLPTQGRIDTPIERKKG